MEMKDEVRWLLEEKYGGEKSASVFNESIDEIKNKYSWGEAFFADLERLNSGTPLAYLIGHMPFLNCTIYLDSHPLIPRPETEFWVEKVIAEVKDAAATPPRILDLCAGSGCIGVAIAKALPNTHVTFAEIETSHLPTIAKNLHANDIDPTHYQIFQSDLFDGVSGQFDFILSNPPYIDPALDRVETSVKEFEPSVALYGGRGGIEIIERLITGAAIHLSPAGTLYLEHEPEQVEAVMSLAVAHGFTAAAHNDQYNQPRYSRITFKQ